MESLLEKIWPLLKGAWAHRWLGVGVAWLVCLAGWVGVSLIPTKYESTARVYVNADPILTPLLHGLAADTNPGRQLDYMRHTLLSRPNLEEAARLAEINMGTGEAKEELLRHLATTIRIDAITQNLLAISYRSGDPRRARNIVQALLTIFADKTTGNSRREMDTAEQFLDGEIAAYQKKLRDADMRRAELNREYPDLLPIDQNGSRLDQAKAAVRQLEAQLSDATADRDSLRKQLAAVPPMLSVDRAPQVIVEAAGGSSSAQRSLDQARKRLAALRSQYTDQYPDVIAARQEIAALEAEARNPTSSDGTVKSQIPNTVYDQLKVKLAEAESALTTVERKLTRARADLARIQAAADAAPGILVKARDMDRDYTVIKATYDSLVQRRQAAQIADSASTKTDQIQFRVVDPPQVPILPVAPKRALLYSVVLLLGLGAGVAVPVALLQLDRSMATVGELRSFGIPVIGSVSLLVIDAFRERALRQIALVSASTVVLLATYGTLLAVTVGLHLPGMS